MSYSLRSWFGIAFVVLIASSAISRLVGFDDEPLLLVMSDGLIVCAAPAMLVWVGLRRVNVREDGIEVRPGVLRLRWDEIARFELRDGIGSGVSVVRQGRRRRIALTTYPITTARARAIVTDLNAHLSAS